MTSTTRLRGLLATSAALGLVAGFGGLAHAATPEPTPTPSATETTPSATASATASTSAAASPSTPAAPTASTATQAASATSSAPAASPSVREASPMISVAPTTDPRCATTTPLTLFNINDFHGRLYAADELFTPVEQLRATQTDVILASAGDNVGASIFDSFILNDNPAIDILNAANLQVSAPGNHEFDKGLADFQTHIEPRATFDYVAANMTGTDMAPYKVITTASGIRVAYIGAEVYPLAGLVDMSKMQGVTVSPEVAAINAVADQITAAGAADVIVAEVHNNITTGYNANVDVVFNGHTHESYAITNADGIPVVQAGQYGEKLGRVDLAIGAGNIICGAPAAQVVTPPKAADTTLPRIQAIIAIQNAAKAEAAPLGARPIGTACTDITRGGTIGADGKFAENRGVESLASDMVANAFRDIAGAGKTVIGLQNPGGTRADILTGEVTVAEAAAVLPFANTIMTKDVTGQTLKMILEQQWQQSAPGVPVTSGRTYLQLGISDNLTYTYDETRALNDRITGIYLDGVAIDPAATYTVTSGSFLINGGDNFMALKGGTGVDTGKSDLESFISWIETTKGGTLCPDTDPNTAGVQAERQAVSLQGAPTNHVTCTAASTFTLGQPTGAKQATDTLNFTNGVAPETTVTALAGDKEIGTFKVVDGVAQISLTAPAEGEGGPLVFRTGNGTTVQTGTVVDACPLAAGTPTVTVTAAAPAATPPPMLARTGSATASGLAGLALVAVAGAAVAARKR